MTRTDGKDTDLSDTSQTNTELFDANLCHFAVQAEDSERTDTERAPRTRTRAEPAKSLLHGGRATALPAGIARRRV